MAITWKIDPMHSDVQFKIRHLMVTNVTGAFKKFDVTAVTETDDFSTSKNIEFTADIDSISTNDEQRDAHLKGADFFEAEKYPQLKFVSKSFQKNGEEATLTGDLTIKDITKPVTLNVEIGGSVVDPYGRSKAGFTVTGKISRKDFGITWGAVTEAGNVVLGDDVRFTCEIQLVKQA
jgi:polyisoprenoid-binding protein YceI